MARSQVGGVLDGDQGGLVEAGAQARRAAPREEASRAGLAGLIFAESQARVSGQVIGGREALDISF